MKKSLLLLAGLALWTWSAAATADDKDLLKARGSAPPNILIVFGNSETTEQPIQGASSAWDGDGDSPVSKMGAAKTIIKQFVGANHTTLNIGIGAFSHGSSSSNVSLVSKSWLYSPLTVDFPSEPWQEPIGTIERWGLQGEGPCTNLTTPSCTDRSPKFIGLPTTAPTLVSGPFFGSVGSSRADCVSPNCAFIYVNGTVAKNGTVTYTERIQITLTKGNYGDAFKDGTLSGCPTAPACYTLADHSIEVTKAYQILQGKSWVPPSNGKTPNGDPANPPPIPYVPSQQATRDFFYTTKAGDPTGALGLCAATDSNCGNEIGFLNDDAKLPIQQRDLNVNATCAGWEFQSNNATTPLVKIPRDYCTTVITSVNKCNGDPTSTCAAVQDSLPCVNRLMRPQAKLVSYNQATRTFTANDYDNPGYATNDDTHRYDDGCDKNLLGAVDAGLNDIGRQAILLTQNGNQAPIKNLLQNILDYFNKPSIDGFQNGTRTDDPNATCRNTGVILIYDNFNGCQNDTCDNLTKAVLTQLKQISVPVYVIGFGVGVGPCADDSCAGWCIANHTGAVKPDKTTPGYYPVSDANGLFVALGEIASLLNESPQTFSAAAVSATQATGGQMAYLASFSPTVERSIWTGRLNGYKLDPTTGFIQVCGSLPQTPCADGLGQFTIKDPNDPHKGATIPFPSSASVLTNPSNPSLIWNAGQNLHDTPGTGATVSSAILTPNATLSHGTYNDISNDTTTTVPTNFYLGRKIVFSLPQATPSCPSNPLVPPTSLPIPAASAVPETRYDMTYSTSACWWSTLKTLLAPQTAPPSVGSALTDTDAGDSLRFIWGDRDAVTKTTDAAAQYGGQKLGDIFHSGPLLVGSPNDVALKIANPPDPQNPQDPQNYGNFFNKFQNRRRVLYAGANDGLLHAFDAGAVGRDTNVPNGYDLGTGAELFAFAPRAIMQIYKPLKDAVGAQTTRDEWTVDLSPSAADVFIDTSFSTTPDPNKRAWHTVLVSGMREGSPFEGTSGTSPLDSQGSYFALDITQPDELTGNPAIESPGSFNAPKCLNQSGDTTCARDWPTVLWEITDTGDLDAPNTTGAGHPDMGETWSKAAMGRVKVCTANCGTSSAANEDHYVAIFGGGFDRERKNRRGNWLYIVDIETGMTLYKANSTCGGDPVISSCTPTYFGSIPSGPTAVDFNGDGYLDLIYVGDLKGQLWRIDLTDLRKLSSAPGLRFRNQLDLADVDPTKPNAQGRPFLFFKAGPATLPSTCAPNCLYSMYHRPDAINLGYNVGGRPALGLAFGTGDRDDIRATIDPPSLTYPQRFYYVVDTANTTTTTESDLTDIANPTASALTSVQPKGWMLELINGERVVGDTLTVGGIIRFPTFNPPPLNPPGTIPPCANPLKCGSLSSGVSRLYSVLYTNGNAYPTGSTDRGQTQTNATFITGVTGYIGGTGGASGLYWSGGVQNPTLGVGRKITVRSWKEKTSRP